MVIALFKEVVHNLHQKENISDLNQPNGCRIYSCMTMRLIEMSVLPLEYGNGDEI